MPLIDLMGRMQPSDQRSFYSDPMVTGGKAPAPAPAPVQQPAPAPQQPGILSKIGTGVMNYLSDPINRKQLALGFNAMRLNPDATLARSLQSQIETAQAMNLLNAQGNRTVQALRAAASSETDPARKKRLEELAALVEKNPSFAKEAVSALIKPTEAPSAIREYEYAKKNFGFTGTYEDFLRAKSPPEGGDIVAGEYAKQIPKAFEGYEERGSIANRQNSALNALGGTLSGMDTGGTAETKAMLRGFASRLGLPYNEEELADAQKTQAFARQIVAEELRQNKGPQTDFDARFAETYLPGLGQEPEANQKIMEYMQSRNLIDALLGRIASGREYKYEQDINLKRFLDSARTTVGATVEKGGNFITFKEFYNAAKSEGHSDRKILEGWMGLH